MFGLKRALAEEESLTPAGFGEALRSWRRERGLSQFQLALVAEVSPRHLSFLETGRSRPSREMVFRLAEALDVPLRSRNELFLVAGFAPVHSESTFSEERMAPIRRVVGVLLDRHDPYPAYVMDGAWNVLAGNRAHEAFLEALLPRASAGPTNILRLLFSPELLRPFVLNWEEVARAVLLRALAQVRGPHRSEALKAILREISQYPGVEGLASGGPTSATTELFIPVTLRQGSQESRWITTLLTFGAATDVTLSEIVVECFFPADEATDRLARGLAESP